MSRMRVSGDLRTAAGHEQRGQLLQILQCASMKARSVQVSVSTAHLSLQRDGYAQ